MFFAESGCPNPVQFRRSFMPNAIDQAPCVGERSAPSVPAQGVIENKPHAMEERPLLVNPQRYFSTRLSRIGLLKLGEGFAADYCRRALVHLFVAGRLTAIKASELLRVDIK